MAAKLFAATNSCIVAALATVGGGLAVDSAGAQQAAPSGTISSRLIGDWDSLDPALGRSTYGFQLDLALYDRLLSFTADGGIGPGLAESWVATPSEVTFKLKKGPTCSDGTPVTPAVVARSIARLGDASTKAPNVVRTLGKAGFTVNHDDAAGTVTVTLKQPYNDLLLGFAMPWSSIICPTGLDHPDTLSTHPDGSGPFVLESAVRGASYTLRARPEYNWGPDGASTSVAGFPQHLVFKVVENEATAANLVASGGLDIGIIQGRDTERLDRDSSLKHQTAVAYGSDRLLFRQGAGHPTDDPALRQALARAVDANGFNRAMYFGLAKTVATFMAPGMPCYTDDNVKATPGYDPAAAMKILDQAGWVPGSDGIRTRGGQRLSVRVNGYQAQNAGPEYLLESFRAIGVDAKLSVTAAAAI